MKGAQEQNIPLELHLVEAGERLGGTIHTVERDGYRCEWGPNGFLDSKPSTLQLARDLGLGDRLLASDDASRRRYVTKGGRLIELPTSPPSFFKSPLLSVGGRFRIVREMWVRKRVSDEDETVADFATRRLGREAYEALIDPFVSGIFAGNPERLSVASAFPRLVELERDYGSLIKASRRLKKEREARGDTGNSAGPGGRLTSFPGGMRELIDALAAALGHRVHLNSPVGDLRRVNERWQVSAGEHTFADVDHVVLAIPAFAAAGALAGFGDAFKKPLMSIPYAAVTVVALGFARDQVEHSLDGFGFLVPSREESRILGCLWTSSVFPGQRAPQGHVLLRLMVGGSRHPELALLDDEAIVNVCKEEVGEVLGLKSHPSFVQLSRHTSAIPQYELGHRDRLAALKTALESSPGLWLAGNAFRGVGINDCTRESDALATQILSVMAAKAA